MEIKCLVKSNEHQFIRMQITHMKVFNTVHQQQGHTFIATTQSNVSVMFNRNLFVFLNQNATTVLFKQSLSTIQT